MINYQMRNGIVMVLQEAIMRWNNKDTTMLKSTILKIHNTDGYGVRMLEELTEIDGKIYKHGDFVFEILEDDMELFRVYKDKRDGMLVLEVYTVDLLTPNELKVEDDVKMQMIEESLVC